MLLLKEKMKDLYYETEHLPFMSLESSTDIKEKGRFSFFFSYLDIKEQDKILPPFILIIKHYFYFCTRNPTKWLDRYFASKIFIMSNPKL